MAAEWYYTTNKQQMGPVTWEELRELADSGIIKPHDLVWSEGMDEWIKAINQEGLLAGADGEGRLTAKKSSYGGAPKPPPSRRSRREEEDDDDNEPDEKEEKRQNRKRQQNRAQTAVGIKVGLILVAVIGILMVLGCAGGLLIWWSFKGGGGGGGPQNYTARNIRQGQFHDRQFTFQQGKRVTINVVNTLNAGALTDVDLYVFRGNAGNPFVMDEDLPQFNRNCRVEFVVPATDTYRVRLLNRGPGVANSCDVTIDER